MTIQVTSPDAVGLIKSIKEDETKLEAELNGLIEAHQQKTVETLELLRLQLGLPSLEGFTIHYYPDYEVAMISKGDVPKWTVSDR